MTGFFDEKHKHTLLKAVSVFLIAVAILNFVLFVIGRIDPLRFWIITIVIALMAYLVLPRFYRKK